MKNAVCDAVGSAMLRLWCGLGSAAAGTVDIDVAGTTAVAPNASGSATLAGAVGATAEAAAARLPTH